MLYAPITIEQYLEDQIAVRDALLTDDLEDLSPLDAQRILGRIDMLKTVIEDLKIILAGPVEIP